MIFESADLSWDKGQPFSKKYNDIYFSKDGAAEVERVFINPTNFNQLVRENKLTSILELGFGSGLNFCVTAERFLKQTSGNYLHFISFEKHPLTLREYSKVFDNLVRKIPFSQKFRDQIPPRLKGWHRRKLCHFYSIEFSDWRKQLPTGGQVTDWLKVLLSKVRPSKR